jgi:hypothetical protein
MIALPIACAAIGAILPTTPLVHVVGFASLPITFVLILLGMIAAYIVLVEFVKKPASTPFRTAPSAVGRPVKNDGTITSAGAHDDSPRMPGPQAPAGTEAYRAAASSTSTSSSSSDLVSASVTPSMASSATPLVGTRTG